jgi:hypothetical protein
VDHVRERSQLAFDVPHRRDRDEILHAFGELGQYAWPVKNDDAVALQAQLIAACFAEELGEKRQSFVG